MREPLGDAYTPSVRQRREALNLNQTDLGILAGVHRATVRALELGRRSVEAKTLANVLRSLGCRPASTMQPIFTVAFAAAVARAILSAGSHGETVADLVADWYHVVDAASGRNPQLPDTYVRLRDRLPLTATQRQLLDDEAARIFVTEPPEPAPAVPPASMPTAGPERWRHGRKIPRNLYRQTEDNPYGEYIGVVDTPELAAVVVEAVNRMLAEREGDDHA